MNRLTVVYQGDFGPTPAALIEPKVRGGKLRAYDPFSESEFSLSAEAVLHVADTQYGLVLPYWRVASFLEAYEEVVVAKMKVAANKTARTVKLKKTPVPPKPIPDPEPLEINLMDEQISGWGRIAPFIQAHRSKPISPHAIVACGIYALATVNVGMDITELRAHNLVPWISKGEWPPHGEIAKILPPALREAFSKYGKAFMRSDWPSRLARYTEGGAWGLRDRELRRAICLKDGVPWGLGLVKTSFMLMLLGHDLMCFDTHMMAWMCMRARQPQVTAEYWKAKFSSGGKKEHHGPWGAVFHPQIVKAYEEFENTALVAGKVYYDPKHPLGITRAHWLIWEHLRKGIPAPHLGLIEMLGHEVVEWKVGIPKSYLRKIAVKMRADPTMATMQRSLPIFDVVRARRAMQEV